MLAAHAECVLVARSNEPPARKAEIKHADFIVCRKNIGEDSSAAANMFQPQLESWKLLAEGCFSTLELRAIMKADEHGPL